jgi:hypothetical protein
MDLRGAPCLVPFLARDRPGAAHRLSAAGTGGGWLSAGCLQAAAVRGSLPGRRAVQFGLDRVPALGAGAVSPDMISTMPSRSALATWLYRDMPLTPNWAPSFVHAEGSQLVRVVHARAARSTRSRVSFSRPARRRIFGRLLGSAA